MTVPEIAEAISPRRPTRRVLGDGMRKYRWLAEVADATDDGFFPYRPSRGRVPDDHSPAGLVDEVRQDASFNASACMNCGICTAICPMGLDHLPREIFAMCFSA